MSEYAWIITAGKPSDIDPDAIGMRSKPKRVVEYHLSDIGRYLLFPGPIEVESRLMGCECRFKPTAWNRLNNLFARGKSASDAKSRMSPGEDVRLLLSRDFVTIPPLKDLHLARHIDRLRGLLQPFDPVVQEIESLPMGHLLDIRGVCEDEGGHRTNIQLAGDMETKRRYIVDNLLKNVPITLQHARIADGLYEMRGLADKGYRCDHRHRLLKFHVKGGISACLLDPSGKVDFWIEDIHFLQHLQLLQQALDTNPVLKSALEECLRGQARALRLMINHDMDIDYSRHRLPGIYQKLFRALKLDGMQQEGVIRSLNSCQKGVSFSFVPQKGFGDLQAITSISVLHDVRALDPLRQKAPQLYAEISSQATLSEAGRYYLLESIKGRPDEAGL